ncbi:MAG: WYL domain-containing protein [Nitrospinaceae bacterium]|jgi:predicted DNA-binding transcriptional regulator YafY|nr:WYL domain-containing protein [Nitrospinaceae bacterium]
MRYEKPESIFRLALMMQGSADGVSLQEISVEFNVSRRTAERMRDSVTRLFPQAVEVPTGERMKRWRIPSGTLNGLTSFSTEELTELHNAISIMQRDNLSPNSDILRGLIFKLRAVMKPNELRRVETDLEPLLEAEGLAMRPGPREIISNQILANIRDALIKGHKIRLHYRARNTGKASRQVVCPYGFLYGNRHYLVAYSLNPEVEDYRLFILANIEKVKILDKPFARDPAFSLKKYAEQSFGAFQEQPFQVAWKFSPKAAPEAQNFFFHPNQEKQILNDGSLLVRFTAGGALEMAWHLYTWGEQVEVLEPTDFWDRVDEQAEAIWDIPEVNG